MAKTKEELEIENKDVKLEDMPLNSLADYIAYNKKAREMSRKCRVKGKPPKYPVKQCPVELHPTERVIFMRNDQAENDLPVTLYDAEIDYKRTLKPGETYDLPIKIVDYLVKKGTNMTRLRKNPDGTETPTTTGFEPRFSFRTVR